MNTLNTGRVALDEKSIRDVAVNLKHLLDIAETTRYLGLDYTVPPSSSILNAVCGKFGFSSVKGMTERLKSSALECSIYATPVINLLPALRNSNPALDTTHLHEISNMADLLIIGLLTAPELPKGLTAFLSRLRCNVLHPDIAAALHAGNSVMYAAQDTLLKTLIGAAVDSVSMEYMWMDSYSSATSIPLHRYFKPNSYKPELRQQLMECGKWLFSDKYDDTKVIASTLHGDVVHACYTAKGASLRNYSFGQLFRNKLLARLSLSADQQGSYIIFRNLMLYPNLALRLLEVSKHNLDFRQCSDPLHPEFALGVFCEMHLAQQQAIDLIQAAISGDLSSVRQATRLYGAMYDLDMYGLVSFKSLMDVFDFSMSSQAERDSLLSYPLLSPNALYWLVQLVTIEFLKCVSSEHAKAGVRYIQHVMEKYPAVAMTESMSKLLHTAEFRLIRDDLLGLVRQQLSLRMNPA